VKIYPAQGEPAESSPQFKSGEKVPGLGRNKFLSGRWLKYFAGTKAGKRASKRADKKQSRGN
jgi:hypothetical protein